MRVCIHEDRPSEMIGVKLAALSLLRFSPDLRIIVSAPDASPGFEAWARDRPGVELRRHGGDLGARGWDVKPTLLLRLLESNDEVVWIDSDVLVTRDFRPLLAGLPPETLVVTEESRRDIESDPSNDPVRQRTEGWALPTGRRLPGLVNTGVLRVTGHHVELLETWRTLLTHPRYLEAQARPWQGRPSHMMGDQEVLTALLGSAAFSGVPVKMLKEGVDIAQCHGSGGYAAWDRLRSIRNGLPTFIHSSGGRPWSHLPVLVDGKGSVAHGSRLRNLVDSLHFQLSPYTTCCREYRDQLDESANWMDVMTTPARVLEAVFFHHPALQELPLAVVAAAQRRFVRPAQRDRLEALQQEFQLESSPLGPTASSGNSSGYFPPA